MAALDHNRVLALAPNPGSVAAARRLDGTHWTDLGHSERAVWGRCQGSAARPYETIVDLQAEPAYACSCPSRAHPCKHALGLMILWSTGRVPSVTPEATYARAWPAELADSAAARQRAEVRAQRVADGLDELDELDRWVTDQIRGGLAGLERAGYAHFDAIAARMVDAQAPGVASVLRAIPAQLVGDGWPERLLTSLAGLHLLISAHRRLQALPADLAATVRSRVGYPVAKDQVRATPGVRDRWLALGSVDTVEFQMETRRVWLLGAETGRWGMWLTFAPPGQRLDTSVLPGQVIEGDLHFYPGSGQHRVLLGERSDVAEPVRPPGENIDTVHERFAALLAKDPWASRLPTLIRATAVLPPDAAGPWRLRDDARSTVKLERLPGEPWPLLAHSAAGAADVFGEWNGGTFRPLSVLAEDRVLTQVVA